MRSRVRERRTHGSVRGLRREPLVYSTIKLITHQKTEYSTAHQRHTQAGNLKRYPAFSMPGIREKGGRTLAMPAL